MTEQEFPSWPHYDEQQIEAVERVLRSGKVNYWTGEEGRAFESEFAQYCGVKYAVAVSNGTAALELALLALGIGPGDEVIVTSRTFIASASAIVRVGATPVFADVDRVSQNFTTDSISQVLSARTKALIAVHFNGWPCDMDPIVDLAKKHQIRIVEDCAQAHGATYKGRRVGSLGDIAAFSFCQDKIMTTAGEGGMVTTNDKDLWNAVWSYKDHGKSYDAVYNREHPLGFKWLHESIGTNWRMTELQAAIGRIQLRQLDVWLDRRKLNANFLEKAFSGIEGLRVDQVPENIGHANYKYYAFVEPDVLSAESVRIQIMSEIISAGIPCSTGGCGEIYLEKAMTDLNLMPEKRLEVARELGESSLQFFIHPTLNARHMERTGSVVKRIFEKI